jgi:hypothetical protein
MHSLDEVGNKVSELHRGEKKGITTGKRKTEFSRFGTLSKLCYTVLESDLGCWSVQRSRRKQNSSRYQRSKIQVDVRAL